MSDTEPTHVSRVPRLSDPELREVVEAFLSDKVFSTAHLPLGELLEARHIFLPLAFGCLEELDQIGCIYEYLDNAAPMAINGRPSFFSMRILHVEDWKIVWATVRREHEKRTEIDLVKD